MEYDTQSGKELGSTWRSSLIFTVGMQRGFQVISVGFRCWIENCREMVKINRGESCQCFCVDFPDFCRTRSDKVVVEFGEDGHFIAMARILLTMKTPQPGCQGMMWCTMNIWFYWLFNAVWQIYSFCVHQMLVRDGMHVIDLGVINTMTLIRAISARVFGDCHDGENFEIQKQELLQTRGEVP